MYSGRWFGIGLFPVNGRAVDSKQFCRLGDVAATLLQCPLNIGLLEGTDRLREWTDRLGAVLDTTVLTPPVILGKIGIQGRFDGYDIGGGDGGQPLDHIF